MKKFFFFIFLVLFSCAYPVVCDEIAEEILLDEIILEHIEPQFLLNVHPNKQLTELLVLRTIDYTASELEGYNPIFSTSSGLYIENSFEVEKKKNYKNFSLGIKYDNRSLLDGFEQMRTLYYEYHKDNFLFKMSYKRDNFGFYKKDKNISFSFAPEYKLTDRISLKYVYTKKRNKKNSDLMFSVKPFKTENINFDFGAGQIYYNDDKPVSSQFLFSTEFKF